MEFITPPCTITPFKQVMSQGQVPLNYIFECSLLRSSKLDISDPLRYTILFLSELFWHTVNSFLQPYIKHPHKHMTGLPGKDMFCTRPFKGAAQGRIPVDRSHPPPPPGFVLAPFGCFQHFKGCLPHLLAPRQQLLLQWWWSRRKLSSSPLTLWLGFVHVISSRLHGVCSLAGSCLVVGGAWLSLRILTKAPQTACVTQN